MERRRDERNREMTKERRETIINGGGIWTGWKWAGEVEERQKAGTENMYRGARTIAQRLTRGGRGSLASKDCRSGEWPETGAKFEFSFGGGRARYNNAASTLGIPPSVGGKETELRKKR